MRTTISPTERDEMLADQQQRIVAHWKELYERAATASLDWQTKFEDHTKAVGEFMSSLGPYLGLDEEGRKYAPSEYIVAAENCRQALADKIEQHTTCQSVFADLAITLDTIVLLTDARRRNPTHRLLAIIGQMARTAVEGIPNPISSELEAGADPYLTPHPPQ